MNTYSFMSSEVVACYFFFSFLIVALLCFIGYRAEQRKKTIKRRSALRAHYTIDGPYC